MAMLESSDDDDAEEMFDEAGGHTLQSREGEGEPSDSENECDEFQAHPPRPMNKWVPTPLAELASSDPRSCLRKGAQIAHNFIAGWEVGTIAAISKKGGSQAKEYYIKYDDEPKLWHHHLLAGKYGTELDKLWTIVTPA